MSLPISAAWLQALRDGAQAGATVTLPAEYARQLFARLGEAEGLLREIDQHLNTGDLPSTVFHRLDVYLGNPT